MDEPQTSVGPHTGADAGVSPPLKPRGKLSDQASRWRRLVLGADLLALLAGSTAAWVAVGLLALPGFGPGLFSARTWFAAVFLAFTLTALTVRRRDAGRLPATLMDSCGSALRVASTGTVLALATGSLVGAGSIGAGSIGPAALVLGLTTVMVLLATRIVVGLLERRARLQGRLATHTLVVGAGTVGAQVTRRLLERPQLGLRPIGFLDADPIPRTLDTGGVPVLGSPAELDEICQRTGARQVVLAFTNDSDHELVGLVDRCRALGVGVLVVPRLYESINHRAKLAHLGGLPLFSLRTVNPRGWQFALKHLLDRVLALAGLLVLGPLLLTLSLVVRVSSGGPVVFRQRRVGRDGEVFELLKFRTMIPSGVEQPFTPSAGSAPGGVEGVDRRTPIGRWLRATSLDELPQLLNVLRGEMSLIGPRPERPEFVSQFAGEIPNYDHRHRVKPGITGWAQVNGLRGQTSIADRTEWDNHYVENWSPLLDLRTLALTLCELLRFREGRQSAPSRYVSPASAASLPITSVTPPAREPGPAQAATAGIAATALGALPGLRLVSSNPEPASAVWFCGYCGELPSAGGVPAPVARVCRACGQGLLLEAPSGHTPGREDAFLVVDSRLTVQALSRRAEQALGLSEDDVTDLPVAELLVGADAESDAEVSLASMLVEAAAGGDCVQRTFVRPRDTFGVRVPVRITSCGPPRAALIVFESGAPQPPRLRLAAETGAAAPASASAG